MSSVQGAEEKFKITRIFSDKRKHKIEEESKCLECVHFKLCSKLRYPWADGREKICLNYEMGTSEYRSCEGCINRFTRWIGKDEEALPCFKCEFEEVEKDV